MKVTAADGTELAVEQRGSGVPLVLVHGFPLDGTMWNAQMEGLADCCRVIVPDLRGFGRSGASPPPVTMEQFADDLAVLLDALGVDEPVVLCGLSMGGYVAFQFWSRHAQRLKSLILCDTRSRADTPEVKASRQQTAQRVLAEGPAFLAESMPERLFAAATRDRHPHVVDAVREMIRRADPHGVAAASQGMALRPDMTDRLGDIRMPVLVMVGREDVISPPEEMRGIAEAISGAMLVEIPEAGHMAPMENPTTVNQAIREFLDTLIPLTG